MNQRWDPTLMGMEILMVTEMVTSSGVRIISMDEKGSKLSTLPLQTLRSPRTDLSRRWMYMICGSPRVHSRTEASASLKYLTAAHWLEPCPLTALHFRNSWRTLQSKLLLLRYFCIRILLTDYANRHVQNCRELIDDSEGRRRRTAEYINLVFPDFTLGPGFGKGDDRWSFLVQRYYDRIKLFSWSASSSSSRQNF